MIFIPSERAYATFLLVIIVIPKIHAIGPNHVTRHVTLTNTL